MQMIRFRDADHPHRETGSSGFGKLDDPLHEAGWSGIAMPIIRLLEADNPHREAGSSGFMKQDNPAEAKDLFGKFDKLAITYSETANVSNISDDTCDHKHTLNKYMFILHPSLVPSCLGLSW